MSRSNYSDELDQWSLIRWRGAVKSAIRGRRGQAFLIELRDALDALPEKKLCDHDLQRADGLCCAIGAVGKARGIDMTHMDPEYASESGELCQMFDIADAMVREIEYENDECGGYWWAENQRDEVGRTKYEKSENGMYQVALKKNADGQLIDKNGCTKEQFDARQDEFRWGRIRSWVDKKITAPRRET